MSDTSGTRATRPFPRWRRLYVIAGFTVAAVTLGDRSLETPWLRTVLDCAVVVAGWGAMCGWVRANRIGLDQAEWGGGAARTIGVRAILSSPGRPVDPVPAGPSREAIVDMREVGRRRRHGTRPVLR